MVVIAVVLIWLVPLTSSEASFFVAPTTPPNTVCAVPVFTVSPDAPSTALSTAASVTLRLPMLPSSVVAVPSVNAPNVVSCPSVSVPLVVAAPKAKGTAPIV